MTDFTTIDVAKLFQGIVQQVFVMLKTILNTERFVKAVNYCFFEGGAMNGKIFIEFFSDCRYGGRSNGI